MCLPFLKLACEQEKHKHEQGLMHKEILQEVENDIGNLELAEDFEEDSGDLFILLSHLPTGSSGKATQWEFNIGTDHNWIHKTQKVSSKMSLSLSVFKIARTFSEI